VPVLSDRLFAGAWMGVCAFVAWRMWHLAVPFAYEPVGPKAFPILLAALMAVCCALLLIKPDREIRWPGPALLGKGVLLIVVLLAYAAAFDVLGFAGATILMVVAVSRLFGASWQTGLVSGLAIGVAGYFLFDHLLDVSLPLGRLWR
jgi:putative tricarboxylic transport membrane protein